VFTPKRELVEQGQLTFRQGQWEQRVDLQLRGVGIQPVKTMNFSCSLGSVACVSVPLHNHLEHAQVFRLSSSGNPCFHVDSTVVSVPAG
jgi:hypothetical protein